MYVFLWSKIMDVEEKELVEIINKRCEADLGQLHTNSRDGKVTKTVDTSLIAKDIVAAGYCKKQELLEDLYFVLRTIIIENNTTITPYALRAVFEQFGLEE